MSNISCFSHRTSPQWLYPGGDHLVAHFRICTREAGGLDRSPTLCLYSMHTVHTQILNIAIYIGSTQINGHFYICYYCIKPFLTERGKKIKNNRFLHREKLYTFVPASSSLSNTTFMNLYTQHLMYYVSRKFTSRLYDQTSQFVFNCPTGLTIILEPDGISCIQVYSTFKAYVYSLSIYIQRCTGNGCKQVSRQ